MDSTFLSFISKKNFVLIPICNIDIEMKISRLINKNKDTSNVSAYLPWEELFVDGTILCKDWGLLRVWNVEWPDTSISDDKAELISESISKCFQRYTEGDGDVVYWFVTQRVPSAIHKNEKTSGLLNMGGIDKEIEEKRMGVLSDRRRSLRNINWCCCKVKVSVSSMGIDKDSREKAEDIFNSFENLLRTIDAFPKKLSINSKLPEESIMSFLKVMTGFKFGLYSAPKEGMSGVSQYVSTMFIEKGKPMMLGEREVQALTINSFPSETYSGILFSLLALPCSFRWVTRWIPKNNYDSQEISKKLRTAFRSGIKGWKAVLYEETSGEEATNLEAQAVTDTEDVEEVLTSLTHGETLGELTSTLVLDAPDKETLSEIVSDAKKVINASGFDFIEENQNSNFIAWLGSLPGDSTSNRRKPLVTATNLSHIVPFTGIYSGARFNKFLYRTCGVGWPHAIGKLVTNEPYFLNLNGGEDDVGHTFIIGSTGGGKSVLMAFLASQWMRYPESRVIYFDKDRSFENLCKRTGGRMYVPGEEEGLRFVPLSGINDNPGRVISWLETTVEAQGTKVTPDMIEEIRDVVETWAGGEPTLQRFLIRLEGTYPKSEVIPALKRMISDPVVYKLFSGEEDYFGIEAFPRKTMIEMGVLMNMGDSVVLPVLDYLFSRMDSLFDKSPHPTLLILDEAWKFLSHPAFRKKIKEWLKTLRKKKVFVIMAMQNIQDVDDAEEFLTSCHTRIYLPNPDIREGGSEVIRNLYKKLGLSDGEMDIIGYAERKRDYYISQREGSALVNFFIDQEQLEYLSLDGN